jgi:NitT/TauT family transport system ATP-binding protein
MEFPLRRPLVALLVLSSSSTHVADDLAIDLPAERDQLSTRSDPRFTELRAHVHAQIQHVKERTTA